MTAFNAEVSNALPDSHGDEEGRQPAPLLVHNLLNDFAGLASLLGGELRRESWLNAYLLAAGMNQIVEDYLHPDPYSLGKAAKYLARLPAPAGSPAAAAARGLGAAITRLRGARPRIRRLSRWQVEWAGFVQQLADLLACPTPPSATTREALLALGEALRAPLARFPSALRRELLRLPSCFRSFDQQPADVERIARRFAERWPDRSRALVVVGLRTSGSYLAPLYVAALKARGYQDVRTLTFRPGRGWLGTERAVPRDVIRHGGLALLTDDPPTTGGSLAKAASALERAGVPARAIVLLLQLFGSSETLPSALREYESVLLPWEEWTIHARLTPAAVQATLADFLGPASVVRGVERLPLPPRAWERSHVHARYQVQLANRESGRQWEQQLSVKGAGLGYFGEHSLALARELHGVVPEVYGFRDGLVYRAWLPEEQRLSSIPPGQEESLATAMAAYVALRNRALAVEEDVSTRLFGQGPAWEVASDVLSQVFGWAWLLARVPVVDPLVRRLLRVARPSVIDGNMALSRWFADPVDGGRLRKIDFDERAFSNLDLVSYDPVFDLASLAANADVASLAGGWESALPRHLRRAFAALTGQAVDAERWLLYQLVHLWDLRRQTAGERPAIRRAFSRAVQRYYAELYFHDLAAPVAGSLCAIDIDGVLETDPLGFPSLTPSGASALRALTRHGYRPVLVTGRSLDEVRERCQAYRLAGGVAEYGAVVYNHGTGQARELLSTDERADLDRVRAALSAIEGVHLDPDYHHAVRAYRRDAAGRRRGLGPETVATVLATARARDRVRPIAGDAQTDFMAVGVDKGTGLRVLAGDLDSDARTGTRPLAFAVGDAVSDLPMFELADMAFTPANADAAVRRARVRRTRRPYQAGLALAVAQLLGHRPGGCPTCRTPRWSRERRLLLALLATPETGRWGIPWRMVLLTTSISLRAWSRSWRSSTLSR